MIGIDPELAGGAADANRRAVEAEFDGGGTLIHDDMDGGTRSGLLRDAMLDPPAVSEQVRTTAAVVRPPKIAELGRAARQIDPGRAGGDAHRDVAGGTTVDAVDAELDAVNSVRRQIATARSPLAVATTTSSDPSVQFTPKLRRV